MENNSSKNILLTIMGVLIVAELAIGIITIQYPLLDILSLIPLLFVALYGFWLYKIPHGNMLKYAMLIFALARILESVACIRQGLEVSYNQTAKIIAAVIIVYVSGRLNRMEQNKYLLILALALILAGDFIAVISFANDYSLIYLLSWFGEPVLIITIMIAYFVRFKEHKEAGLVDTPKKPKDK